MNNQINRQSLPLASMLVHEMKAPLAAIQQQLLAVRDGWAGDVPVQISEILTRSRNRISDLLDFLDRWQQFANWTCGAFDVQAKPFDLAGLVNNTISLVKPFAEQMQIDFLVHMPDETIILNNDEKALTIALRNCIENAVKYNSKKGKVEIELSENSDSIKIKITDQGIGIPEAEKDRIFEPFFRASNTQDINGSGLGLAIASAIINKSGGEMKLYSEPGRGTSVECVFFK